MGGDSDRLRERHRFARDCAQHEHSSGNGFGPRKTRRMVTQRENAKALAKRDDAAKVVTPFEAASATMQQRGERHLGRMANIVEKTIPHVEAMELGAILDRVDDVERLDKVAGRTFGISDDGSHGENIAVNIAILGG